MKNNQLALKIFLQHYFNHDWLYSKQLELFVLAADRPELKYMDQLNVILIMVKQNVSANMLLWLFEMFNRTYREPYQSLLLYTHYLDRATHAYKEGNQVEGNCWMQVAKGINYSYNRVRMKKKVFRFYIQAQLENAKKSGNDVQLWANKLERWTKGCQSKKWIKQNVKASLNLTWHDIQLKYKILLQENWIKYCQRMSDQAVVEGDLSGREYWEALKPYVWGRLERITCFNSYQKVSLILFIVFAKRCEKLCTGKLWKVVTMFLEEELIKCENQNSNYRMPVKHDESDTNDYADTSDEEYDYDDNQPRYRSDFQKSIYGDVIQRIRNFDQLIFQFQKLQISIRKETVGMSIYERYWVQKNGKHLNYRPIYFKNLLNVTKKAENCLRQYLLSIDLQPMLVPDNTVTKRSFSMSYYAFSCLYYNIISSMLDESKHILSKYHLLILLSESCTSEVSSYLNLKERIITVLQRSLTYLDFQLDEDPTLESFYRPDINGRTFQFQSKEWKGVLNSFKPAILAILQNVWWVGQEQRIDVVKIIFE